MENPAWQAATASATAIMVLPTPGGLRRATLDLAFTNSRVATSRTLRASRSGWKAKPNSSNVLWCGSPDSFRALRNRRPFPQAELLFEEQVDEVEVAHLAGLGAFDELGDDVGQVGQSEPGGVVADPVGGQTAHAPTSSWSGCAWSGCSCRQASLGGTVLAGSWCPRWTLLKPSMSMNHDGSAGGA